MKGNKILVLLQILGGVLSVFGKCFLSAIILESEHCYIGLI